MANRVGQQFGNYRLMRLLGQGGFAEVYLSEHLHLGTQAAIKILHTQVASEDVKLFRKEARTIAHLVHPHIVRIFDFGVEGTTPFLVMDYAPNGMLRMRHPKGVPVPLPTVISYVKQIADALQYAHDEHLIHRDIKPENLLLGRRQEILLSDFGVALIVQTSRSQSIQNVAGTATYMAPEQFQGMPRPVSDQYALGIVVYEWLSGNPPYHGSFTEVASQHLFVPLPPLQGRVPAISPMVEQVVMKALAKDPKQRFARVQAFANALEHAGHISSKEASLSSQPIQPIDISPLLSQSAVPTELIKPPSQRAIPIDMGRTLSASSQPPAAPEPAYPQPTPGQSISAQSSPSTGTYPQQSQKQGPNSILIVSIIILLIALSISGLLVLFTNKGHVVKPVTSTVTPTPTPTNIYLETPPPQAVFYDTFINNALAWGLSNSAGYIRTLADHKLTLTNTNPNTTLIESLPTNAIYDNFTVSVDLTIVKAGTNDSAGIYVRGDSNLDHDYRIEINSNNTFDIAKEYLDTQNNPYAVFLDGPRSSSALHPLGVQNTITVIMKGSQLMLYINDTEVSSITDSDFTTGQIALFAHTGETSNGVTVSFSKVEVDHPPDQLPSTFTPFNPRM